MKGGLKSRACQFSEAQRSKISQHDYLDELWTTSPPNKLKLISTKQAKNSKLNSIIQESMLVPPQLRFPSKKNYSAKRKRELPTRELEEEVEPDRTAYARVYQRDLRLVAKYYSQTDSSECQRLNMKCPYIRASKPLQKKRQ